MEGDAVSSTWWAVAISSDGTRIVSTSPEDSSVRVWDVKSGKAEHELCGHLDEAWPVAFSSDGTRIVSGSNDKTVRVWNVSTGKVQNVLEGHTETILSVASSSDGTRIASSSADRSLRIWDVTDASTGKVQSSVLEGHTDLVTSVAFSSDGTRLASASFDRSVRLWDVSAAKAQGDSVQLANLQAACLREETFYGNQTPTGWFLSLDKKDFLMFVPFSAHMFTFPCILVLSNGPSIYLPSAALGNQWHQCYSQGPARLESEH